MALHTPESMEATMLQAASMQGAGGQAACKANMILIRKLAEVMQTIEGEAEGGPMTTTNL